MKGPLKFRGQKCTMLKAKACGRKVKVVYSVKEAVKIVREIPSEEFALFAVGFETTAPLSAIEILNDSPENLSFLTSHRLIPQIMELFLDF